MTLAPRYTLADLELAERDLAEGDSGRHNNPGEHAVGIYKQPRKSLKYAKLLFGRVICLRRSRVAPKLRKNASNAVFWQSAQIPITTTS